MTTPHPVQRPAADPQPGRVGDADEASAPSGDAQLRGHWWLRWGRFAWATVGILVILAVVALFMGRVALVVIPLVLALFPAALLAPAVIWLKSKGVPAALAALLALLGLLLLLAGIVGVLIPIVGAEVPDLVESFQEGLGELEGVIAGLPFGPEIGGVDELIDQAQEQLQDMGGQIAGGVLQFAATAAEFVAALGVALVALFFYLKDGSRITSGIRSLLPRRVHDDFDEVTGRIWNTIGRYFRGQMLIAAVDAFFIGLGLIILGVPLAIPLAVLVFFGGFFPIVGAFVTGALAVVVALADAGIVPALIVLGIVIGVQQLESNILEPFVLGNVIALHPLMVITALSAGGVMFGILGAFLAVPVAASIARAVDYIRERYLDDPEAAQRAEL